MSAALDLGSSIRASTRCTEAGKGHTSWICSTSAVGIDHLGQPIGSPPNTFTAISSIVSLLTLFSEPERESASEISWRIARRRRRIVAGTDATAAGGGSDFNPGPPLQDSPLDHRPIRAGELAQAPSPVAGDDRPRPRRPTLRRGEDPTHRRRPRGDSRQGKAVTSSGRSSRSIASSAGSPVQAPSARMSSSWSGSARANSSRSAETAVATRMGHRSGHHDRRFPGATSERRAKPDHPVPQRKAKAKQAPEWR